MPAYLYVVAQLAMFVAVAYYISIRKLPGFRSVCAFLLFIAGIIGCYEGFLLAVREDGRLRYGTVISGTVIEKYKTNGEGQTVGTTGRKGPKPGVSTFLLTRAVAHRLAYGSFAIRIVDYRYPCGGGIRKCVGSDYVAPEYWSQLRVGDAVSVRQGWNETETARLDENPQLAYGLWQLGLSAGLLYAAAALGGALPKRRLKYLKAPAVVLAVEPVQRGGQQRWKVKFGYFDAEGNAQESLDEVSVPTLKSGDDCIAVYRPSSPDLATLQLLEAR